MKKFALLFGFGFFLISGPAVYADLDPQVLYDNFNAKKYEGCKGCINSDKWIFFQRGDNNTEVGRSIKSKKLYLSQRTWGDADTNTGNLQGRNRVRFRDSVNFSGVCFVPRIKKYLQQKCATNPNTPVTRVRYLGNFYDSDADKTNEIGNVYGWIEMNRFGTSTTSSSKFQIAGFASECLDADCTMDDWSTYDNDKDPNLLFKTAITGKSNKKEMCVGYDRANHQLVFSFGKDVRTVDTANHDLPAFDSRIDASLTWHVIETRSDVENCMNDKKQGYIEADVDNVKIRSYQ